MPDVPLASAGPLPPSALPRPSLRPLGSLTIRGALVLGFALIVLLWVASGYDITRRLAEVEAVATAVNARFVRAEELLSDVRREVFQGSIYLRDALFEMDPARAHAARLQLRATQERIDGTLREYASLVGSGPEPAALGRLREALAERWQSLAPVLEAASAPDAGPPAQLRERVAPQREVIIRISEEIHAANLEAFDRQQQEVSRIYRAMHRRVWIAGAAALVLSLGIAILVSAYAGKLETRVRQQMEKEAENTRDLQRLSARLVHVQEDERRAIARELHDEVGQALTAVKAELGLTQRRLEAEGAGRAALLDEARAINDRALNAVRDLSQLLRPALLDDLGLLAALGSLLRGFSRRTGIRADLVHEGLDERLASEIETCVYRIVQEALTNVERHAHATTCHVSLNRPRDILLVGIEDNGQGFDAGAVAPDGRPGLGLLGIRERVAEFRGAFRLDTAPGRGTRLTVELPALVRPAEPHGDPAADRVEGTPAVREPAP